MKTQQRKNKAPYQLINKRILRLEDWMLRVRTELALDNVDD